MEKIPFLFVVSRICGVNMLHSYASHSIQCYISTQFLLHETNSINWKWYLKVNDSAVKLKKNCMKMQTLNNSMCMNQSSTKPCVLEKDINILKCLKYVGCPIVLTKVQDFNSLFRSTFLCNFSNS